MKDDDLKHAFKALCSDYEELLDEATQTTQSADERVGLALFKIDEACAAANLLRQDAHQIQEELLSKLLSNCHELEDIFLRVNLIEVNNLLHLSRLEIFSPVCVLLGLNYAQRFVGRMLQTTRELEKRTESVSRATGPVFNPNTSVNRLLRSFSIKVPTATVFWRGAQDASLSDGRWSPVVVDFNTKELIDRLEKSDARELGISISSSRSLETREQVLPKVTDSA